MKLATIFLTAFCLQAAAFTSAQVTYKATNKPLQTIFTEVGKITGYNFFYRVEDLAGTKNVTVDAKELSLEAFVRACLLGQGLDFYVDGKTVVIEKKKVVASAVNGAIVSKDPIEVTVRVVNEEGEPVAGVTVQEKGTKNAVATNGDGVAKIKVDINDILVLTAVNIISTEAAVDGRKDFSVKVKGKTGKLDEVQVIAYGTTSQRLSTGNVTSIKAKDIEKQPVNNLLLALQGRSTGLFISQNSGLPGGGVSVRIQGQNSILNGNDPLYVIDGIPFISQMPSTVTGGTFKILGSSGGTSESGAGNPFNYINPNDIESIEILKDASATAIYGSRAANGAILITTKKGKIGKTKFSINVQNGIANVNRKVDMMNSHQYLEMRNEALKNDNLQPNNNIDYDLVYWDTTRYTNWQKTLIGRTANYLNANASVSGGNSNTQYLIGTTYHRETVVFPGSFDDTKIGLHFNINSSSLDQKFGIQLSGSYLNDNNKLPMVDLTTQSLTLAPNAPKLFNEDGSLNWQPTPNGVSTWTPPLVSLYSNYENTTNTLLTNLQLKYSLFNGLEIRSNFGFSKLSTKEFTGFPLLYVKPEERTTLSRSSDFTNSEVTSWIIEPQLNYKSSLFGGSLDVLLGTTFNQLNTTGTNITGFGYNSDAVIKDIKSAPEVTITANANSLYKYNAAFSRINYNYKNKYIINLALRRDGSTRFGPKDRFHNFSSAGLAWIFSNEQLFTKQAILSFGKIRASYGTTGSDQIGNYKFMNLYSIQSVNFPYQNIASLNTSEIPNPYLQWEETKKLQLGIDLGFLKDKILLNATFSQNRSSNQLLTYSLPITTGAESILTNFPAVIQNNTWELSINTSNINNKHFTWNSNFNITLPKNKLKSFPDLTTSSYSSQLVVGQPISVIKLFKLFRVDPITGLYEFLDKNDKPTNFPSFGIDDVVLYNTSPKIYGGFENTFSFKGLELTFLVQFVKQNAFLAYEKGAQAVPGTAKQNQPTSVLSRWRNDNPNSNIQKFSTSFASFFPYLYSVTTNSAYGDASYLKLRNASISYNLPTSWTQKIKADLVRLYCNAQNILTITKYKGLDPETQSSLMPPLRTIVIGFKIDF